MLLNNLLSALEDLRKREHLEDPVATWSQQRPIRVVLVALEVLQQGLSGLLERKVEQFLEVLQLEPQVWRSQLGRKLNEELWLNRYCAHLVEISEIADDLFRESLRQFQKVVERISNQVKQSGYRVSSEFQEARPVHVALQNRHKFAVLNRYYLGLVLALTDRRRHVANVICRNRVL